MTVIRKCSDAYVETEIDDEMVVMSLHDGEFFSLKGTALAVWSLIDGTRDEAALVAALAATYDVAGSALAADVGPFLADLRSAGLISQD